MLISAIMPTRGRPSYARQAVACFQAQIVPAGCETELVIVDDADLPSFSRDDAERFPSNIVYRIAATRMLIGAKRNLACSIAAGDVVMHIDDDDWSAPERLADQIARVDKVPVTGYSSIFFYDERTGRAYRYVGIGNYSVGTSLVYSREWQQKNPFPENVVYGEDNAVVVKAARRGQLLSVSAAHLMVARVHAGNTNEKSVNAMSNYVPVGASSLPSGFCLPNVA